MSKDEIKPINNDVLNLSEKLKEHIKIENGKAEIERKHYLAHLPEGITEKELKTVKDYHETFTAAAAYASGQAAVDYMKTNKDCNEVETKFHTCGRDYVAVNVTGRSENPRPGKPDEKVVSYGTLRVNDHTQAGNRNSGQLSIVQQHLRSIASDALSK